LKSSAPGGGLIGDVVVVDVVVVDVDAVDVGAVDVVAVDDDVVDDAGALDVVEAPRSSTDCWALTAKVVAALTPRLPALSDCSA
jgi:hypothetical protein